MKNIQRSIKAAVGSVAVILLTVSFVSCTQGTQTQEVKDYDISEIYGYTFHGNITATSGDTLIPTFIMYDKERAGWNMDKGGMQDNQFYYYAVKNSPSNYTLYWFGAGDYTSMTIKDTSKAAMVLQLGINSPDEIVLLLTNDGITDVGAMKNTRVPMKKQTDIPKNDKAPEIGFDPSIKDVTIEIPSNAADAEWEGETSYEGTFDCFVGPGGTLMRTHGTCGKDSDGKPITPVMGITKGTAGSHTVTLKVHRNEAHTKAMSIEAFDIHGVKVLKDGNTCYLKLENSTATAQKANGASVQLNNVTVKGKLENGKITIRVSFKPGGMGLEVAQVFRSK